jgi:hypothetical protein
MPFIFLVLVYAALSPGASVRLVDQLVFVCHRFHHLFGFGPGLMFKVSMLFSFIV